ncbi:N-acetylglucosaminyl transferase component-domain-containing protein [Mycena pura]|uniref:N-acetylglucosaminyl transferase component-domain-containing protein n=1 Tax=Mycena pura TaxID=153505 RepID=A0AAD6V169_9AGAR|nr:N-acetylglucosaminyl transferase component-domain-containing protein [Mycena pura]
MVPTIFWPVDVVSDGLCYGWKSPALCVACVIPDRSDAESALASLNGNTQWSRFAEMCGNSVLLGKCTFPRCEPHFRRPLLEWQEIEEYTIIYYHRHSATSLRFYSLETPKRDMADVPSRQTARTSALASSLEHDFTRTRRPHNFGGINEVVINQFNAAKTLDTLLRPKQVHQLSAELSKYLFDLMDASLYIPRRIVSLVELPKSLAYLKNVSSTVQQLDVRAKQTRFLSYEVSPLRKHDFSSILVYSARYTNFFNTVWLILNDITIGIAFGSFLCENHIVLAQMLNHVVEVFLVDWVRWALHWLDSWPAGLKLNTELSRFYSHTFSDLVAMWGYVLRCGAPHLPELLFACGIASTIGGMTTAIALVSDFLGFITAHIAVCYLLARALYARFLHTFGSLWNLFRGKRFNVLRNRTDAWEYDTDQLLFGTILFTLLAFLFPTVLAYYTLFALLRLGTILLNAALETQLAFMNHFPLFALMLRVKDPWRLSGGIYVAVSYDPDPRLVVKNQPIPLSIIFIQYIWLWRRLAAHYNPLRLLWLVLRGERLVAIPRDLMR